MPKLLILLVSLPIFIQAVQLRSPPSSFAKHEEKKPAEKEGTGLPSKPTLREFLKSESFHVSMAPLFLISKLVHMSVLNVLKQNDLPIASLSGASTGGLASATWASMDHGKKGYAQIYGQNLSRSDCEPKCDKYQKFYLNYLDSPMNSEMEALNSIASPEAVKEWHNDFLFPMKTKINRKESHLGWAHSVFWLDLFNVKQNFDDLRLPVATTGMHWDTPNSKYYSILMGKGNLHLAVLGTMSTFQNSEPIPVHDKWMVSDGFVGDEHGARGYDALPATKRPASMLNILPVDAPWMPLKMMDVSKSLQEHKHLKQIATVLMYVRQPMLAQELHLKKAEAGEKHFTYKDLMLATHEAWTQALDSELKLDEEHPNAQLSKDFAYYQEIDAAPFYPKFEYIESLGNTQYGFELFQSYGELMLKKVGEGTGVQQSEFSFMKMNQTQGTQGTVEYQPEGGKGIVIDEVVDKTNILQNPELVRLSQRFTKAALEMYGDEEYKPFRSTLNANSLPEQTLIDLEKKKTETA